MKDEFIQRNNDGSVFPKGVHFTPVPSPLLGPMLKQVSSYNELVCLLRFLNLIHLRKESPKWIEQNMLVSDDVLQSVILMFYQNNDRTNQKKHCQGGRPCRPSKIEGLFIKNMFLTS